MFLFDFRVNYAYIDGILFLIQSSGERGREVMEIAARKPRANRRNGLKSTGLKPPNGKAAGRYIAKSEKQSQISLGI